MRANPAPGCVGDDDFPLEVMLSVKEVEMVDSLDELKILAISLCKGFSKFLSCSTRGLHQPKQDYPEFLLQEKGQSGETKGSKRRPISSRKTYR